MKVSAKTEYACIAVLELALSYDAGEPVRVREIAEQHGIPPRFLVQILLQLKGADLVNSTRGASGGYQLLRAPEEITLWDVMSVIEGTESGPTTTTAANSPTAKVLLRAWKEVSDREQELLKQTTFADLVEQAKGEAESMYYI